MTLARDGELLHSCPTCRRRFDEAGFCPFDGTPLATGTPDRATPPRSASGQSGQSGPLPAGAGAEENPGGALERNRGSHEDAYDNAYDKLIGQLFDGRYYLENKLGEGRLGVVFSARHAVIERPLAIKVLKRAALRDPATIRRFVQEAQAASRIGHPNIVEVTDFGTTADGLPYSVMEFVAGQTLGMALRLGAPFATPRALRITMQIARALGAAHDKGIVHRDLKPDNVFLLDRDGQQDFVKIVDFGIAKVTPPSGQAAEPRLTRAGAVVGTPAYMAPEQAAGRSDIDGRADIYALGGILYEMICGQVPHRGDSTVRALAIQTLDPIEPPSKARPDLPIAPALEAIVMRALATQREQRYQTMGELLEALEAILAPPVGASVTGSPAYRLAALPPGADPGIVPVLPAIPLQASGAAASPPLHRATEPGVPPPQPASQSSSATRQDEGEPERTTSERSPSPPRMFTRKPVRARGWRWRPLLPFVVIAAATVVAIGLVIASRHAVVTDLPKNAGNVALSGDARAQPAPGDVEPDAAAPPAPAAGQIGRPTVLHDAGPPVPVLDTPNHHGAIQVQVRTRPAGAKLYEGIHYRGPDGTQLEQPFGAQRVITCRQPGYKPGTVKVNFDGGTPVVLCVMKRIKICINGIKNPFDDCEIDPNAPVESLPP